jgi:hypothetical protein
MTDLTRSLWLLLADDEENEGLRPQRRWMMEDDILDILRRARRGERVINAKRWYIEQVSAKA